MNYYIFTLRFDGDAWVMDDTIYQSHAAALLAAMAIHSTNDFLYTTLATDMHDGRQGFPTAYMTFKRS